ncbi:Ig-like domain-containing protein [Stenotrophomonas sp. PS02298]|uniref:Ig-like domain-containing protein n=1 Tax=Stenotrophomonas sp. PS02298 TaxID=2991424 RepID=UPI00249CB5F8|nr:Ig-like domain-containing protein [Stenotrophomonas sp. PS02298]
MKASISVVSDKTVVSNNPLREAKGGGSIRVKAVQGGRYLLAEDDTGVGPENITVKRVGKNLHVALEGTDPDQPELIIESFFDSDGQLVGLGEDGVYHEYIAADGDTDSAAPFLMDGVSSPLALGAPQLAGFGEGLIVAGAGLLPWALAGVAGLAGGAIIEHNKGGDSRLEDTTAPENKGIGSIVDDKGPLKGSINPGDVTDDNRPTLGGSGQEPGDQVVVIDNGKVVGEVIVDGDGNWSFTPEEDLGDGEHSLQIVVKDPSGNSSAPSEEIVIVIDTSAPAKPGLESIIDDQGPVTGLVENGGTTDDKQPTLAGRGDAGDIITIIDNGNVIGEVEVGGDGAWSFTPEAPLSEGEHVFEVVATDPAGNSSELSDGYVVIVDTTPPDNSGIGSIVDDQGTITGPIVNGGHTDDTQPMLTGKGDAGDTVTVLDNGSVIGEVQVDDDGVWTFTPQEPLGEGEHSFEVVVTDPSGNSSGPSDEFVIIVDTTPPAKPGIESIADDQGAVTGPVSNGGYTDDTQPTLSGRGDVGDTVTIIDNGKAVGEVQVGDNGIWTFTPEEVLSEGEHVFEVVLTDPAGNSSEPSDSYVINLDSEVPDKPVIETVYDDQGDKTGFLSTGEATDDAKPTIEGCAGPDTIVIIRNGDIEIGRVPVDAEGRWAFEPSLPLAQGAYNLTAVAINKAGTASEPSDGFDLVLVGQGSPAAPAITSVVDDVGAIIGSIQKHGITDDARPTINGTAPPGMTVSVYIDGVVFGTAEVAENGVWSYTLTVDLADGLHNITASASDGVGNNSPETGKYPINVDTTSAGKPSSDNAVLLDDVGSVTGPIVNGTVTDDATPTFEGKGESNGTVIIYDNGEEIGRVQSDANGDCRFSPSPGLGDGHHSLNYEVVDQAGNVSPKSDPIDFVVDTKNVVISIDGAIDNAGTVTGEIGQNGVTDDVTPTLHGKGTVGGTVKVYEGGELLGEAVVDAAGRWSITPLVPLSEGVHSLTATVTTVANGESGHVGPLELIVDLTPPNVPTIEEINDDVGVLQGALSHGQHTDDATPTLSGKADAGAKVNIYDKGSLLGSVEANANGDWSFTPNPPLLNGGHDFTVTAQDKGGNESDASAVFAVVVDTLAPDAPVIETVYDDTGSRTGNMSEGETTDDVHPTVSGKAEANSTVVIKDRGTEIGRVVADMNGKWVFEPAEALAGGEHELSAEAIDAAGNSSPPSNEFRFSVDNATPTTPKITNIRDDVGVYTGVLLNGGSTDDAMPMINGNGKAGDTIEIRMDGLPLGSALVGENNRWSFTPTAPVTDGVHVFTSVAVSAGGAESEISNSYQIRVDTVSPDAPVIESVHDNAGVWTGDLVNGKTTDDRTPTFAGKAEAKSTILVFDRGKEVGFTTVDENGNWKYAPEPLAYGEHSFTFISFDVAGNLSDASKAWTVVITSAVRSTDDIARGDAVPSLEELLVDGDMDMFAAVAGGVDVVEVPPIVSFELSSEATLHESWAINSSAIQSGVDWLVRDAIADVNVLEKMLIE